MKTKRHFGLPLLLIAAVVIVIGGITIPVVIATESNNYKRDTLYAFSYGQFENTLTAEYAGTTVLVDDENVKALYQQLTSGSPALTLRTGDTEQDAVYLTFGDGNSLIVSPTDDDSRNIVSFTYNGRTKRFLLTAQATFHMICSIVDEDGWIAPNTVIESKKIS